LAEEDIRHEARATVQGDVPRPDNRDASDQRFFEKAVHATLPHNRSKSFCFV
jgi:hypothetical protein